MALNGKIWLAILGGVIGVGTAAYVTVQSDRIDPAEEQASAQPTDPQSISDVEPEESSTPETGQASDQEQAASGEDVALPDNPADQSDTTPVDSVIIITDPVPEDATETADVSAGTGAVQDNFTEAPQADTPAPEQTPDIPQTSEETEILLPDPNQGDPSGVSLELEEEGGLEDDRETAPVVGSDTLQSPTLGEDSTEILQTDRAENTSEPARDVLAEGATALDADRSDQAAPSNLTDMSQVDPTTIDPPNDPMSERANANPEPVTPSVGLAETPAVEPTETPVSEPTDIVEEVIVSPSDQDASSTPSEDGAEAIPTPQTVLETPILEDDQENTAFQSSPADDEGDAQDAEGTSAPENVPEPQTAEPQEDPEASEQPLSDGVTEIETADRDASVVSQEQAPPSDDVLPLFETIPTSQTAPEFDLVRVEADGTSVIAGIAMPNATVLLMMNGAQIGEAVSGHDGSFVIFADVPASADLQELQLLAQTDAGQEASTETIMVLVEEASEETDQQEVPVPTVLSTRPDSIRVLQAPETTTQEQITIDTISYSRIGDVLLSGTAQADSIIRIYIGAEFVAEISATDEGAWSVTLPGIEAGIYTLRVDEIGADGQVSSRAETPFQREFPQAIVEAFAAQDAEDEPASAPASAASIVPSAEMVEATEVIEQEQPVTAPSQIVIQPGNNLWTIARDHYGRGVLYTQIFRANQDQIRNPDLIYPGQIFDLPSVADE